MKNKNLLLGKQIPRNRSEPTRCRPVTFRVPRARALSFSCEQEEAANGLHWYQPGRRGKESAITASAPVLDSLPTMFTWRIRNRQSCRRSWKRMPRVDRRELVIDSSTAVRVHLWMQIRLYIQNSLGETLSRVSCRFPQESHVCYKELLQRSNLSKLMTGVVLWRLQWRILVGDVLVRVGWSLVWCRFGVQIHVKIESECLEDV